MMNLTVNEEHSYIEVEVYGAYNDTEIERFFEEARRLVERNGRFSELEVHHGAPQNALAVLVKYSKRQTAKDPKAMEFMQKLHKYALVSDNPGISFRVLFAVGAMGKAKFKIFKSHERDAARAWIEDRSTATDQFDEV